MTEPIQKKCINCWEKAEGEEVEWDWVCDNCIENWPYSTCDCCYAVLHSEKIVERRHWPDMCIYCLD